MNIAKTNDRIVIGAGEGIPVRFGDIAEVVNRNADFDVDGETVAEWTSQNVDAYGDYIRARMIDFASELLADLYAEEA